MTETSKSAGLIRMALMGIAFIALTVILIVFQPGSPRNAQTTLDIEATTSVTRVADPLTAAPADTTPVEPALVTVETQVPVETPIPTLPQIAATTNASEQPTNMRDMTFSAISNLKSVTTGEAPAPGQPGSLLYSVVKRSIANEARTQTTPPAVTQIEPVSTTRPRAPKAGAYFVRPGDTLLSIANEVYGDTSMSAEIYRQNTNIISSPDSLKPGMVLKLPTL
jgi:nucleoid-associated protein YgaU